MTAKPSIKGKSARKKGTALPEIPVLAHDIVCSVGVGLYIVQHSSFVYISPLFHEITGYAEDELLGKHCLEHVYPDDREMVRDMAIKRLKGEGIGFYEYRFIKKNREVIRVLEMVNSIIYKEKRAVVGSFMDITDYKGLEKTPEDSEIRYRQLFQNMNSGVALYEATADGEDFIFKDFNRAAEKIDGVRKEDVIGKSVLKAFPGVKEFGLFDVLQRVCRSGKAEHFPITRYHDERIEGWRENYVYKLPSGEIVAVYDDITERKRMEAALQESERRYRLIAENMIDYMWLMDMNLKMQYVSPSTVSAQGFTFDELRSMPLDKHMTPASFAKVSEVIPQLLSPERLKNKDDRIKAKFEIEYYRKDGSTFISDVSVSVIRDDMGKPVGIVGVGRDITERKKMEQHLGFMATHDSLTGLPNRTLFIDRLTLALAHAQRNHCKLVVMMLDLDRFKDINDTLGHNVGDQLLKGMGDRLMTLLRKSDTVARMGGDEFIILLPEVTQPDYAAKVAQKILDDCRQTFKLNDYEICVTTSISIGITVYPDDGEEVATLLKNADVAMYLSKELGGDRYRMFADT